ncbi:MAG: hypothetical protein U9Q15_02235 [Patescibacteria group bacterium]|nr:hypothetical protein [Patescibacteria group bacterium]
MKGKRTMNQEEIKRRTRSGDDANKVWEFITHSQITTKLRIKALLEVNNCKSTDPLFTQCGILHKIVGAQQSAIILPSREEKYTVTAKMKTTQDFLHNIQEGKFDTYRYVSLGLGYVFIFKRKEKLTSEEKMFMNLLKQTIEQKASYIEL